MTQKSQDETYGDRHIFLQEEPKPYGEQVQRYQAKI